MIYVPDLNYKCYVVRDTNTIRAYKRVPTNNSTIDYRDYYYNSNYLYQDGEQTFSQYTTLPTCLDSNVLTDNSYYRNDIADILFIFTIICLFGLYLPYRIFLHLFKRFA